MKKKLGRAVLIVAATTVFINWVWSDIHQFRTSLFNLAFLDRAGSGHQLDIYRTTLFTWPQAGYTSVAVICGLGLIYMAGDIVYCAHKRIDHQAGPADLINVLALLIVLTFALIHISKP